MTRCKHGRLIEEGEDCNPYECDPKDGEEDPQPDDKFLPTEHPSGSLEKMLVMKRRYEMRQPIHHPEDNPSLGTYEQHRELTAFMEGGKRKEDIEHGS
jgi:hypothetical protein